MLQTHGVKKMNRESRISKLILGPALSLFMVSGMFASAAWAQSRPECDSSQPRRTPAMSEKVYKDLGKAAELASPEGEEGKPEPKPDFRGALEVLRKVEQKCTQDECNKYEMASIYNYFGWVYFSLEDVNNAIKYYIKLVDQAPEIPHGMEVQTLSALAKLLLQEERLDESLKYINKWMAAACKEDSEMYQLRSNIHYFREDKVNALKDITKAVSMEEAAGKTPPEAWWSLQKALLLDKEDYRTALPILIKMVRHYPKISTWDQLASVYGILEQEDKQRSALDALHSMGGFTRENQYVNLAYLYLGADYPWKAAKLLQEGVDKKVIKTTSRNLQTLAQAYAAAQEVDKSIPVMEQAAASADDGDLYSQLVVLYLNKDNYKKAIEAGKKAIEKKSLRRPGEVHLNMGIAYFEQKQYDSAIKAFKKAKEYDATARLAANWQRHAEVEADREKQLKEALGGELPT